MTQLAQHSAPSFSDTERTAAPHSRTLWRVAGGLALAHVVLLFAGISQEALLERGAGVVQVQKVYGQANLSRVFTGGYIEAVSILVLMAAVVLIARVFSRGVEAGQLAAQTFLALGVTFVAATLAVGFPAGAAAVYWSQHGAQPAAVSMVNDIRNYAFILQVATQAAMALALGIAAISQRILLKWVGWVGVAVGGIGIFLAPFAQNAASSLWLLWWLGLTVLLLRGPRGTDQSA